MSVNISRAQASGVGTYLGGNRTYGSWSNEAQVCCSAAINSRILVLQEERRFHLESGMYEKDDA